MGQVAVHIAGTEAEFAAARRLCRDYRALLAERTSEWPEIIDTYYHVDEFEPLLARLPALHCPPKGAVFVARLDGNIEGCGMTHEVAPGICEIKRVFTTQDARGHGLAKAICIAAMGQARSDGHRRMVLDTMKVLPEAIGLYKTLGFRAAPPFYDVPETLSKMVEFYGIDL